MMLVTFHSVSAALFLEKLLDARGVLCRIIPVPRSLSSSCGYAAEVSGMEQAALSPVLTEHEIEWEAVYRAAPGGVYALLVSRD